MLSRIAQRRVLFLLQASRARHGVIVPCRGLVAAPKSGDGPLMERRPDRELPNVEANQFRWQRTMPVFLALVAFASVAIFNYQKMSSPVVSSTLYALRISPKAREYLGDEIYFKHQIPWITGQMNQISGRINIAFSVKGTKNTGVMRFASFRPTARGVFETTEWSLETADGKKIDLLEDSDPLKGIEFDTVELDLEEADDAATRGFRQMPKK